MIESTWRSCTISRFTKARSQLLLIGVGIACLLSGVTACIATHNQALPSTSGGAGTTTQPPSTRAVGLESCGEAYVTDWAGEESLATLKADAILIAYGRMIVSEGTPHLAVQQVYSGNAVHAGDDIALCRQQAPLATQVGPTEALVFLCDRDGDVWVPCQANLGVVIQAGGGYFDLRQIIQNGPVIQLPDLASSLGKD